MEERKHFKFYRSYYEVAQELPPEEGYHFLMAVFEKQFCDKEPELKGMAKFAYISQKHSIEAQVKGYKDRQLRNNPSEAPSAPPTVGGSEAPSAPPSAPPAAQYVISNNVISNKKEEISNGLLKKGETAVSQEIKPKAKRFKPPTIAEIKAYCAEKKYDLVNAELFFSHYNSKNWYVGKNKMKSWESAVMGWQVRAKEKGHTKPFEPTGKTLRGKRNFYES